MGDSSHESSVADANANISFVSLGCPKALVDSERIVTELGQQGYDIVGEDGQANVVVVNTCGFIDSAKAESFDTIERAFDMGREVVVTGCLGANKLELQERFPELKFISGPADVSPVVDAVNSLPGNLLAHPAVGSAEQAQTIADSAPGTYAAEGYRTRLTPEHYAYLKISEGCNHKCSFCIIPDMRGKLRSRPIGALLTEAEQLAETGAKELLVVAQDLSAYGLDIRYQQDSYAGEEMASRLPELCRRLGDIVPWVRLHYVYPYPSVDDLIPLMAEGRILPYLDLPLQHASTKILKAMRRPAAAEKALERINRWRDICPELAIRSTFIVGFPGETEDDVGQLLDFLEQAQLDRVGCFTYSSVAGAQANLLMDHVDERDKLDRQEMVYETQALISASRLQRHVGETLRVLVDDVTDEGLVGRSQFDAPEIDGLVHMSALQDGVSSPKIGDFAWVRIESCDDHDLIGKIVGDGIRIR